MGSMIATGNAVKDRSVCICYTGNEDRYRRVCKEFARLGPNVMPDPIWCFPNPFNKVLSDNIKRTAFFDKDPNGGYFNCTMAHYAAIKTTYELGYDWLFVVEDDCRFLKDKELFGRIIYDAPDDADILLLDHFRAGSQNKETYLEDMKKDRVGKYWTRMRSARSTACYQTNRKGMKRLIYLYESCIKVPKGKLRLSDQWFDPRFMGGLNCYKAIPNAAIQCDTPTNNSGNERVWSRYEGMGLKQSDYMPY